MSAVPISARTTEGPCDKDQRSTRRAEWMPRLVRPRGALGELHCEKLQAAGNLRQLGSTSLEKLDSRTGHEVGSVEDRKRATGLALNGPSAEARDTARDDLAVAAAELLPGGPLFIVHELRKEHSDEHAVRFVLLSQARQERLDSRNRLAWSPSQGR